MNKKNNLYYRVCISYRNVDFEGHTFKSWEYVARFMSGFRPDEGDFSITIRNNFSFPQEVKENV